jgi:hypothetical protein
MDQDHQISAYDKSYGGLKDSQFLHTKPKTIRETDFLGRSETYIIETVRTDLGDVVFLECVNSEGHVRLKLPPEVVNTIVRNGEQLAARSRRAKAKAAMKIRMAEGYVPSFPKGMKRGKRKHRKPRKPAIVQPIAAKAAQGE